MPATFVLCYAAQHLVFGAVVAETDGGLTVLGPQGELSIRKHQVLLHWEDPAAAPATSREALLALLADRRAWLQAEAGRLPLAELAGRLPQGRVLPVDEIAAALHVLIPRDARDRLPAPGGTIPHHAQEQGRVDEERLAPDTLSRDTGPAEPAERLREAQQQLGREAQKQVSREAQQGGEPWRRAALCLALVQDRVNFRREQGGFVAVNAAERAQRESRNAAAQAQQDLAGVAEQWGARLERGQWLGAGHRLAPAFLAALVSLAAHERRSPHWTTLGRVLNLHEHGAVSVARKLQSWLVAAGAWPGWPALWLARACVRQAFPPDVLAEAACLAQLPVEPAGRADRRNLAAYTIDAASTFDYDDAYSVQADGGRLIACIHIAEPPALLVQGHPVFDEAERRLSSVYTEEAVFPMLPPALSLGRCSLLRGRPREAVTFRFGMMESGLEWLGMERSVIEVRANLDYAQTEKLVEAEPATWGRLARNCEAQALDRVRRGAQVPDRKEVRLDLSDPARVRLSIVPRAGPSNRIVEELAIAYNLAVGLYCQRHRVPALYRVQARLHGRAAGPGFTHARFSTRGAPHEGIACERYVQSTSPNRRFADLAMQRQLVAHAAGQPVPFSEERLTAWADRVEARLSAYEEAERAIQEHWVRVYLTQNPQVETWGIVRKVDGAAARVWLEDLALPAEAEASGRLTVGKRQRFRVSAADPDLQRVWVTPT
ncbi:MAG: ribonuclease catalytic domain-containing protein [SAR324 cluster bacterium]